MTVKEKNDIRNYCIWLVDKRLGVILTNLIRETYLLVGVTENGIYVKKLKYLSYGQDEKIDVDFGKRKFVPLEKVLSYKNIALRYDLLKFVDKEEIEETNVDELRNRIFVPYEIGEVILIYENKYLLIGIRDDKAELLDITGLKNVTLQGIKDKCAQERPKGKILAMTWLRIFDVKVEKQFKEESIKDLCVKVKLTWELYN